MKKKELRENNFLLEAKYAENTPEFINERAGSCLRWYIGRACHYKRMFFTCSLITLFCPLVSSILVGFDGLWDNNFYLKIFTILLGVASSAATGILALCHAQDKWTRYRSASEYLKSEIALYKAGVGIYGQADAHSVFLTNIEEYMKTENTEWTKTQKQDEDQNN